VTGIAEGLILTCGGFLLAVLWMDLIFDSQVRGLPHGQIPEPVLASIAAYYRRATTTSRPMSRLIAAVMVVLLGALVFRGVVGDDPGWLIASSAVLTTAPIALAGLKTVPNAVRLGGRDATPVHQSRLARSIYSDHVVCFAAISAFLVLRLSAVW
jgi:hypothetical protein